MYGDVVYTPLYILYFHCNVKPNDRCQPCVRAADALESGKLTRWFIALAASSDFIILANQNVLQSQITLKFGSPSTHTHIHRHYIYPASWPTRLLQAGPVCIETDCVLSFLSFFYVVVVVVVVVVKNNDIPAFE